MGLSDALLLEAFKDNKVVFIAYRSDSVPGSGARADPYDASIQAKFYAIMIGLGAIKTVCARPSAFDNEFASDTFLQDGDIPSYLNGFQLINLPSHDGASMNPLW